LDILDTPHCSVPYILFKLKEIKKGEAFSLREHAFKTNIGGGEAQRNNQSWLLAIPGVCR
jgi:hypothetical protein